MPVGGLVFSWTGGRGLKLLALRPLCRTSSPVSGLRPRVGSQAGGGDCQSAWTIFHSPSYFASVR